MLGWAVGACALLGLLGFGVACARVGHVRACIDLVISLVLLALGVAAAVLEALRWLLFPLNWVQRQRLRRAKVEVRRLVIFDGVCVLCNRFGRFAFYRLVNADLVSFVPFQDAQHVNIEELQAEFKFGEADVQRRIAFVDGARIFWGADAILRLGYWCDWPYPLARFGMLVPRPLRDAAYAIVADNRYRWFGTQALDKNFARQLCPYYYFKQKQQGTAQPQPKPEPEPEPELEPKAAAAKAQPAPPSAALEAQARGQKQQHSSSGGGGGGSSSSSKTKVN
jgi:predicted DCC family thiol-disulfide oxidoreductase YuxK